MRRATVRNISRILFLIYMFILLKLTVFRSGFSFAPPYFSGSVNLTLFEDLIRIYHNSIPVFCRLFFGNIVWFIPFGLLLPLCSRTNKNHPFLWVIFSGFYLSMCIEFLQFTFGVGVAEIDDLILNTLGCAIGYLIYAIIRKLGASARI